MIVFAPDSWIDHFPRIVLGKYFAFPSLVNTDVVSFLPGCVLN